MKKIIRYYLARALTVSRLPDVFLRIKHLFLRPPQAVILTYHRVVPREKTGLIFSLPDIIVYEDNFRKQIGFLSQHYHVISLDTFIEARMKGLPLPLKAAVITFDDGWEDNYHYAFPILKDFALPATIFLTSDYIGSRKLFWPEKSLFLVSRLLSTPGALENYVREMPDGKVRQAFSVLSKGKDRKSRSQFIEMLKFVATSERDAMLRSLEGVVNKAGYPDFDNSFLNWQQIREMSRSRVTFGSHGATHPILTECAEDVLEEELVRSRHDLEKELGNPITHFAYPNGNYNETVIQKLRDAGYQSAVTVEPGINSGDTDPYRLKRIHMYENKCLDPEGNFSGELFALSLAGIL